MSLTDEQFRAVTAEFIKTNKPAAYARFNALEGEYQERSFWNGYIKAIEELERWHNYG